MLSPLSCLPASRATEEPQPAVGAADVVLPAIQTPKHANMLGLLGGKHDDDIQKTHIKTVVLP